MAARTFASDEADRMLPLVRRIVFHARARQRLLVRKMTSGPDVSGDRRRSAEIAYLRSALKDNVTELSDLGLELLDPESGLVGAPGIVDGVAATLTWKPGQLWFTEWFPQGGDPQSRRLLRASNVAAI